MVGSSSEARGARREARGSGFDDPGRLVQRGSVLTPFTPKSAKNRRCSAACCRTSVTLSQPALSQSKGPGGEHGLDAIEDLRGELGLVLQRLLDLAVGGNEHCGVGLGVDAGLLAPDGGGGAQIHARRGVLVAGTLARLP